MIIERKLAMKRILCLLFAFSLLICFSACDVLKDNPEETQPTNELIHSMPPRSIQVYSEEALIRLVNAAKLSDAEFAEFVAQVRADAVAQVNAGKVPQINIYDDTEKHEVESLVQFLASVGIPMLKSNVTVEDYYFEYRPLDSWMAHFYEINGVRYIFHVFPHEDNFTSFKTEPECVLTVGENSISLHRQENQLIGRLFIGDYRVEACFIDLSEEKTENGLSIQTIAPIEFAWSNATGEVE